MTGEQKKRRLPPDTWQRPRLYTATAIRPQLKIPLSSSQANYLINVLRLGAGAQVFVFDGRGREHIAEIVGGSGRWRLLLGGLSPHQSADARLRIHVGHGLAARSRLDWAVEKMTEAGVFSLAALTSFGTARRDNCGQLATRWERIAAAAATQCGRFVVPTVMAPCALEAWAESLPSTAGRLLLTLNAAPLLSAVARPASSSGEVALVIGRRAGLDNDEEKALHRLGFTPASLGRRVLRVETVGVVALTVLLAAAAEL